MADAASAGVDGGMGIAASSAGVMISNTLTTFARRSHERATWSGDVGLGFGQAAHQVDHARSR